MYKLNEEIISKMSQEEIKAIVAKAEKDHFEIQECINQANLVWEKYKQVAPELCQQAESELPWNIK